MCIYMCMYLSVKAQISELSIAVDPIYSCAVFLDMCMYTITIPIYMYYTPVFQKRRMRSYFSQVSASLGLGKPNCSRTVICPNSHSFRLHSRPYCTPQCHVTSPGQCNSNVWAVSCFSLSQHIYNYIVCALRNH